MDKYLKRGYKNDGAFVLLDLPPLLSQLLPAAGHSFIHGQLEMVGSIHPVNLSFRVIPILSVPLGIFNFVSMFRIKSKRPHDLASEELQYYFEGWKKQTR